MKYIARMSASLLLPGKNFLWQVSRPQCWSVRRHLTLSFIGDNSCVCIYIYIYIYIYTGYPRRKGPNFGRVFLRSNYTNITQNTYIQSSMVTEILNIEKWGFVWCLRITWFISKVLHTVRYLFKNEFVLQNTFTGLRCNLHCALSQRSNVWASLVFLSGRLRCWCVRLLGPPHQTLPQCFWSFSHGVVSSILGTSHSLVGSC